MENPKLKNAEEVIAYCSKLRSRMEANVAAGKGSFASFNGLAPLVQAIEVLAAEVARLAAAKDGK